MRRIFCCILLLLFVFAGNLSAQTTDFGLVVGAGYSGKIVKGLGYSVEGEVKTCNNFIGFNRFKADAGIDYSFLKKRLKVGAEFDYILKNQEDFLENRYRVSGVLTYAERIKNFKISYRAKFQSTFFDDNHSYNKFNPKNYIRNRLQIEYKFFSKPISIYASTEFFLRLYKYDARFIDNWRTIVGVTYRIDKNNSIDFYLRADNEVQVKNRANEFYLGVGYNFK